MGTTGTAPLPTSRIASMAKLSGLTGAIAENYPGFVVSGENRIGEQVPLIHCVPPPSFQDSPHS